MFRLRALIPVALCLLGVVLANDEAEPFGNEHVVQLTDATWGDFRANNPQFLAVFYAPWCGHCKNLKPDYATAAESLMFSAPLVAMDCTVEKTTCDSFSVKGFPTLKWFGSSEGEAEDYDGGRSADDMVTYVQNKVGPGKENFEGVDFSTLKTKFLKKILRDRGYACKGCTEKEDFVKRVQQVIAMPKNEKKDDKKKFKGKSSLVGGRTVAQERRWKIAKAVADEGWEENGDVVHLIEDDFDKFRAAHPVMMVMFYAPWCGHCKNLKPAMAEVSTTLKGVVPVTAVDCDTNKDLCAKHRAKSYPTIQVFTSSDAKKGEDYTGPRTAKGIEKFLRKAHDPSYTPVVEPFVNEAVWEEDNGNVVHMTDDHWSQYIKDTPKALVMFYAPWCGHCKALKPDWAKASETTSLPMVAVDCTVHTGVCSEFGVTGYPTLKFFENGKAGDYSGGRRLSDLTAFGKTHAPPAAAAPAADGTHEEL